ncbi:hypothetical protein I3843_06G048700 [Carya illinoinensis]|nr:hypothetical protein I3843_06G048700 [Carya illinoinensis]KAG7974415.1 hypothetical protein I3843_06G048700 [Carya illinoinensis]
MSSSSNSSNYAPKCLCGEMARLKLSKTSKNPMRPFYSYPNYNREGRPYCEYFLWADIEVKNEDKVICERQHPVQKRDEELQKKEEELQKKEKKLQKKEEELKQLQEYLQKWEDNLNDRDINRTRIRSCMYWGLAILIFWCWIGSRTVTN